MNIRNGAGRYPRVESSLLEGIGQLVGCVAHDIGNVLGTIMAATSLLQVDLQPDDPRREDTQNILDACRRGRLLTTYLVGFARRRQAVSQAFAPGEVVADVTRRLERILEGNVQLRTAVAEKLHRVEGEPDQIRQALVNVCANAVDAMPPGGGSLKVVASNVQLDRSAAESLGLKSGAFVQLQVVDSGWGMDRKALDHATEPFFTTRDDREGLGLAIVHGIMRQHRGAMQIWSEPGAGTKVTLLLPAYGE